METSLKEMLEKMPPNELWELPLPNGESEYYMGFVTSGFIKITKDEYMRRLSEAEYQNANLPGFPNKILVRPTCPICSSQKTFTQEVERKVGGVHYLYVNYCKDCKHFWDGKTTRGTKKPLNNSKRYKHEAR